MFLFAHGNRFFGRRWFLRSFLAEMNSTFDGVVALNILRWRDFGKGEKFVHRSLTGHREMREESRTLIGIGFSLTEKMQPSEISPNEPLTLNDTDQILLEVLIQPLEMFDFQINLSDDSGDVQRTRRDGFLLSTVRDDSQ